MLLKKLLRERELQQTGLMDQRYLTLNEIKGIFAGNQQEDRGRSAEETTNTCRICKKVIATGNL
jgi:hypothetical protein